MSLISLAPEKAKNTNHMKTEKADGFTMTLSTDENGSIHFNLSEDNAFIATDPETKANKLHRLPCFGITFYGGNNIGHIRSQLAAILDVYSEELSVAAEEFLMEFLEDEENLKHPEPLAKEMNLN